MQETLSFNSFTNYRQTVMNLMGDLRKLKEFSEQLELQGNICALQEVIGRLETDEFKVAIVGEFKRGKSTMINALLGKDVLPTDVLPTTATLNKITYSVTPFVRIDYKDGRQEDIPVEKLTAYVTKLTEESTQIAATIREATIYYPINYCKNGVTIIDTPGLNDDAAMTEVTIGVLPQIDAALMVIMAQSPFSESEREFLESKIINSDLGRVMFVVTGIDLVDETDVDKVLNSISTRIQQHVLVKAASTFGENSPEYERYKNKLGTIKVYGLSARMALRAKMKNDHERLERSCFPAFETALEKFLTEDRGAIMLNVPVSRIKTSSIEIIKAIQLKESALGMQKDEFEHKYVQAMAEIDKIRQEREAEFEKINSSSQKLFSNLQPMIANFWPTVESAAMQAVNNFPIGVEDIKERNINITQNNINNVIKHAIAKASQNATENIQYVINQALESEAQRLSGFENSFYRATEGIQNLFLPPVAVADSGDIKTTDMLITTAVSSLLYGVGGLYMGYKKAGFQGALLGGASTVVGTVGGGLGVGMIIGALALPITWPVILISSVLAGVVGTFTAKFTLSKFFGDSGDNSANLEQIRGIFRQAVFHEIQRMRQNDNFTQQVYNQVHMAFEGLKGKIRTETEQILQDTQNNLTQLKIELAQQTATSDKAQDEIKKMLAQLQEMLKRADGLNAQLNAVLNK